MKTKIVTAVLALMTLSLSSFAFKKEKPTTIKEVTIEGKFQKISVGRNIKLVLVPANEKSRIQVAGRQDKVTDVTLTVHNNRMVISSNKSVSAGAVIVYVPATELTHIDLGDGASLAGEGSLKYKHLTVFFNVGSRMDLTVLGKINIEHAEGCDLVYEKNEKTKVYVKQ